MATTSTTWGLGTHKMTADISSSAPVTSPSADSPIKAKSFSVMEGPSKESQVSSASPAVVPHSSSSNGNSSASTSGSSNNSTSGATAAAATAAAAAAVAAAAAAAKITPSSNGIGRVPALVAAADTATDGAEEEGSEAAATSSDSGGDDDEDERGGSSSAPGRVESEAGGAKAAQANGHHGPVQPTLSAGGKAGNGHAFAPSPAPRQEMDDHAARASDAATAALAAALASATMLPPSPRNAQPSQVSKKRKEECVAGAAAASAMKAAVSSGAAPGGRGEGRAGRDPIMMVFRVPQGRALPERVEPPDVDRALAAARFTTQRSPPPRGSITGALGVQVGAGEGGAGSASSAMKAEADVAASSPLPEPTPLPTTSMPCMVGFFKVDETTGVHRCAGTWAMTKADLEAAARIESRASPFEFKTTAGGGGGADFPHTGNYRGYFLVRQPPKPVTKVDEDELHLAFERNSAGGWNVNGSGRNVYGPFTITGRLGADRRLEVFRAYPKPSSRGHRRASTSSHPAPAPAKAPPTPAARVPNRGKHPHSAPPLVAAPAASPVAFANGVSAMAEDAASLVSPPPTSRRVSRTPSYLIKDIGNDGTAHLTHGLRRCVTLLRSVMGVRGKSEWFLEPVDYVKLALVDYPRIIKRPMDLGTIRKKLEGGTYQNTAEFSADVRLVFSNARLYNSDPTSSVHAAARELYELFEAKFAALGPNLDDPPLKRKKSAGGSAFSNVAGGDCEHEPERDRKRKSSGGGKSGGDGGGGGSGTKKARAAAAAAAAPAPAPVMAVAPPPPPPAAAPAPSLAGEFSGGEVPASMLKMQRKIEEMEAQIRRMQGQAVAAQQPQPAEVQKQPTTGTKRKGKSSGTKAGGAKAAKGGTKGGKGSSKKGGGRAAANPEKAAADKAAKAARQAAAKAQAEAAAKAAAAAAVPLTFDEKKALSVAINKLDQTNLTRVVEIIQARMPLGSSDEEIELDIDSMDNLTLRDLQAFVMEVSSKGGSRKSGDSDSDAETW